MKPFTRRLLLLVPLALLLLFAAAYLLLDVWLESAGGRRAVERALAERLGMPVTLQGEFDIMLLPSIGVSGTELVLGPPGPASELARSRQYALALALGPLLGQRLLIQSLALDGGRFYPERLPAPSAAAAGGPAALPLPEINALALREFEIVTSGGAGRPVLLRAFELEDFAAGHEAPFRLAVEGWGELAGRLSWNAPRAALVLDAAWSGLLSGELRLRADAALAAGRGALEAVWKPGAAPAAEPSATGSAAANGNGAEIRLALEYALVPGGVNLAGVRLEAAGQSAEGAGCLRLQDAPALNLRLAASSIDLDALPAVPGLAGGASEGAESETGGAGAVLNLRLAAAEARAGGAVARDAVFLLGAEPDCAGLESDAPQ